MIFELFDPRGDVDIREGSNLPHWYQPGVTYFITFRTEDSIPAEVAKAWRWRRDDWLRRHGVDSLREGWQSVFHRLPLEEQQEYHETFSREYLDCLDRGHGACALMAPETARIVADSLAHFDGQRYHLGDFVVMPNHVHLLVALLGDTEVESQCWSWKKFTATRINQRLNRTGRFWQEESFDHLVRSPEQFDAICRYVADNPAKAGLREGQYLHHCRK